MSRAATRARATGRGRRLTEPVVGVLAKRGRFMVVEPLFERGRRITVAPGKAGPGEMVLVGQGKRGPRVVRQLGRPNVARDVLEALMLDRGLRRSFPRAVESEADGEPAWEGPRTDMTELPTFTVDPTEAKDFDDAISARREDGRTRVWVHIADVSAYVRPGSAAEREAFRRGTSTYVPGAVEPMLPEALSNRACSLVPGEERLAVTVELLMEGATVRSTAFRRTLIRSDARLTYEQVDRIFGGGESGAEPWAEPLEAARAVAAALQEMRAERGQLEVESDEPSFEWDGAGGVTAVRYEEQTESHRMIEALMILANEQVASYIADRRLPSLFRVHEKPDPPAVETLVAKLASLDVATPPVPKHMSPQQAGDVVAEASRMVAAHVRRTGRGRRALGPLVLRSLKPAFYSPRNRGHAGLASARYCHFTSPIRRYPDLVVHRALLAGLGLDAAAPAASEMEDAGVAASAAERAAMQVERDADDVCLAFLLERALADRGREEAFEGEVVGVIEAGAFVMFGDERFEGFLPVRKLRGDWWSLNEAETALVGDRSGRALRLADPIEVVVDRVDAPRGRVDLVPVVTPD